MMTIWASRRSRRRLLRLKREQWRNLIEELGRRGEGRRESGAFLLAPRSEKSFVTRIEYYDDLDPRCLTGNIHFHGLAFSKLWDICESDGLAVAADVHTHPGASVHQSIIDVENPMVARARTHRADRPTSGNPIRSTASGRRTSIRGRRRLDLLVWPGGSCPAWSQEVAVAMNLIDRDQLHRTAKIALDLGLVADIDSAPAYLENLVLQIHVGSDLHEDLAGQAALLTAMNAGGRAMLGGVRVTIEDDPILSLPWAQGQDLATTIRMFGGSVVDTHTPEHPVIVIGKPKLRPRAEMQLSLCYSGWSGGIAETWDPPGTQAMPLAGVVAGALAVSEVFQHALGSNTAACRDTGLSLWCPNLPWQSSEATGPALQRLPTGIWLLGLGHLGQANAWSLGCLPYDKPDDLEVYLVDFDTVIEANHSTGLLTLPTDISQRKTRVVASRLEQLGHLTRLIERPFDDHLRPSNTEPQLALAGFDKIEPRRALGDKFGRVVDAGLGAGPTEYLDILLHTFPSVLTPAEAFPFRSAGRSRTFPGLRS